MSRLAEQRDKLGIAQGMLTSEVTSCFAFKSEISKVISVRTSRTQEKDWNWQKVEEDKINKE